MVASATMTEEGVVRDKRPLRKAATRTNPTPRRTGEKNEKGDLLAAPAIVVRSTDRDTQPELSVAEASGVAAGAGATAAAPSTFVTFFFFFFGASAGFSACIIVAQRVFIDWLTST